MKLSIAVITWNRCEQLIEALNSCVKCDLPLNTQFVVIDNASTDNTESAIKNFFKEKNYYYYYEKMAENIGCGNGRNYAYLKSKGDYVYFLDDDAYIDYSKNKNFFSKAIEIMDSHKEIKTLTTQIYDLAWKKNRVELFGPEISKGIHKIYMFCGGSHFLCRSFFGNSIPYYPNKYGYEEIFPSLAVYDANFINAFAEELTVVHNPLIDKWDRNKKGGIYLYATGLAQNFLMKSTIFPILYTPLNFAALCLRLAKGCSWSLTKHTISIIISSHIKKGTRKRLKYSTISNLYKDFQLSIF